MPHTVDPAKKPLLTSWRSLTWEPLLTRKDLEHLENPSPSLKRFISKVCAFSYTKPKASFFGALFGSQPRPEDQYTITAMLQECLELCGDNANLLSQALQTQCFDHKTAAHWVLTRVDGSTDAKWAIAKAILDACGRVLSAYAVMEWESVCLALNDDKLYQSIARHPAFVARAGSYPATPASFLVLEDRITFRHPSLIESLLVGEKTETRVILRGVFYRVVLLSNLQNWKLLVYEHKPSKPGTSTQTSRQSEVTYNLCLHDFGRYPSSNVISAGGHTDDRYLTHSQITKLPFPLHSQPKVNAELPGGFRTVVPSWEVPSLLIFSAQKTRTSVLKDRYTVALKSLETLLPFVSCYHNVTLQVRETEFNVGT